MHALGIFVQAPIAGRVKRRLAADVGPSTAAEVAWQLGRRAVGAVLGPGYRTVVWYAPASEAAFVKEWLGDLGRCELRPQGGGTHGQRLADAFARLFREGAERVVLLRTEAPGVTRRTVLEAFAALAAADVVLGPTQGGRYYLLGTRGPQPRLLAGVAWPAEGAVAQLRARAGALGLTLRVLRPLREVITARDARLVGLLKP